MYMYLYTCSNVLIDDVGEVYLGREGLQDPDGFIKGQFGSLSSWLRSTKSQFSGFVQVLQDVLLEALFDEKPNLEYKDLEPYTRTFLFFFPVQVCGYLNPADARVTVAG